jgi:DNA polymerase I-like protein with 3'-5' exonuclease and polymerase domains
MKLYGIDTETHDPLLTDTGAGWTHGVGSVLVTGLFNAQTGKKTALNGSGGKRVLSLLADSGAVLVGANIVYDIGWLASEHGLAAKDIRCGLVDVSMAEQCIDEYQQYSLDALARKYLGESKGDSALKAIAASRGLRGDFRRHLKELWDAGFQDEIREYVLSDADQPVRIWEEQKKLLEETGTMEAALTNFKLIKIVLGMKQRGVRVDMEKRERNYRRLLAVQTELQKEFEAKHGKVNFNSPKQLAALFDREDIPYRMKIRIKSYVGKWPFVGSELWSERKRLKEIFTGVRVQKGQLVLHVQKRHAERTVSELEGIGYAVTCNPNIDKHALAAAKKTYDAAKAVAELKQVTSIIDKFLGPKFNRFIVAHRSDTGAVVKAGDAVPPGVRIERRIHADFNIVGARQTGRFSSNKPNLQQVPSKTVLFEKTDREIKLYTLCREIIIPDEGMLMGKADYSGQENRIIAHFAVGEGADEVRRKYNENPDLDFHGYIGDISGLYEEYGEDVGRKYAKNCFEAHSYIETPDGLVQGVSLTGGVISLDGRPQKEEHIIDHRPGYEVSLSNGAVLKVTRDHKFKWFDKAVPYFAPISIDCVGRQLGYRAVTHFGDYKIIKLDHGPHTWNGTFKYDEQMAYFTGLYIGDGSVTKNKYGYGNGSFIVHRFNEDMVTRDWQFGKLTRCNGYRNGATQYKFTCHSFGEWLVSNFGQSCKNKRLPELLFCSPKSVQLAFIAGLIDSDGRRINRGFETFGVNRELIAQEALLLMSLGYRASLYEEPYRHSISCGSIPGKVYDGILYRLNCFDCSDMEKIPTLKPFRPLGPSLGKHVNNKQGGWIIDRNEFSPVPWSKNKSLYYYLKGQTKTLTEKAVRELGMRHSEYRPVTIVGVKKIRSMMTLVMETETHYFRALVDSPNCGFGLGYGMQLRTMMETFGWSKKQAERITELYHEGAPFMKATMGKVAQVIVCRGYVKTLAGRREHLPSYGGRPNTRDSYKGFNKLIQGSAADMTKRAMVELDERGLLDVFPLYLQAHDEIDFGVPKTAEAIRRLPEVQEVMEHAFDLSVPIRVDPEVGPDWGHVSGRRKSKKTKRLEPMEHFIERIIKEAGIEDGSKKGAAQRDGGVRAVRVSRRRPDSLRVQAHRGAGVLSAQALRAIQEEAT